GAGRFGGQDERAFGEIHLLGDRLHLGGRKSARVVEHRELVAFEEGVGEDVVVQIAHGSIVESSDLKTKGADCSAPFVEPIEFVADTYFFTTRRATSPIPAIAIPSIEIVIPPSGTVVQPKHVWVVVSPLPAKPVARALLVLLVSPGAPTKM